MLIANRRIRLIFAALTGMEAAGLTPWLLLLFGASFLWTESDQILTVGPWKLFLILWVGLLSMLVAMDLLSLSKLSDTRFRLTVVGLVILTSLLGVRLLVEDGGLFDLAWLGRTVDAVVNFHRGLQPAAIIVLLSFYLWLRGASLSGREIGFRDVSLSFRLGLLLLILSGSIVALRLPNGQTVAAGIMGLFLTLGLVAISVTRTDEKASAARDGRGGYLTWRRATELLTMVGLTVGIALLVGTFYTPERMLATLHLFDPLWSLLGGLLRLLLYAFAIVAEAVARLLILLLGPLFSDMDIGSVLEELGRRMNDIRPDIPEEQQAPEEWRYAGLVGLLIRIMLVSGVLLVLLWLAYAFLERRRHGQVRAEGEELAAEDITLGSSALQQGWNRLKNLVGLARRYGFRRALLDAISVENIYANLTRIARERGHPRDPSQPPDDFLPTLQQTFPGQDEALARITNAYMQVHYGDEALTADEITRIRADYDAIRARGRPDESDVTGSEES